MVDWNLAVKVAAGGFGLVFIILVMLGFVVWITKFVANRLDKGEPKEKQKVK